MKVLLGVLAFAFLMTGMLFLVTRPKVIGLDDRVDAALIRGEQILQKSQGPDGGFYSDTYGLLKNNLTLTPHVLYALQMLPAKLQTPQVAAARASGAARLAAYFRQPPAEVPYAVYTIAGTIRCLAREPKYAASLPPLVALLRQHQLVEERGWTPADNSYGGWGYSDILPDKPAAGRAPFNPVNANLSATVFALEALRAAGVPADDPAIQKALRFVHRCQNFPVGRDPSQFDDGGFFFSPDEVMRNKAAEAGTDATGTRYRSYGSMTCDGTRALFLCGRMPIDADAHAAIQWIHARFAVAEQPGDFPPERKLFQVGMYYYYMNSLAQVPAAAREAVPSDWAMRLSSELLSRQKAEGSWQSRFTDAKEDDPLVATSEAVLALSMARAALAGTNMSPKGDR